MEYENFYEALKYHLEQKGHGGQALVCRHTDIPRSYLSRIINRGRRAGKRTQKKIARFFGFGLEEFLEMGRRISLGENPEEAVDLLQKMPEEQLLERLTAAVRKEVMTARKLDKTQLLYESIVENSRQMIIRFDENVRITFINRGGELMTGRERSEVMGQDCPLLFGAEFRDELESKIERFKNGGGSFSMELPGHDMARWYYITVTVFPGITGGDDKGQLVGFDVTERRKLDDKLRFVQHGVEMSYVPTLCIADNANIIYVNRAVCDLLGYSRQELERMSVWDINPLITREKWPEKWAWFEKEENVVFAGQYKKKDDEIIPVEFHVSNIKYPDGRRYNVVYVKSPEDPTLSLA